MRRAGRLVAFPGKTCASAPARGCGVAVKSLSDEQTVMTARIALALLICDVVLLLGPLSCGGASKSHGASAAGTGAGGANVEGSSGDGSGAVGAAAGAMPCQPTPELPMNDARCPAVPASGPPQAGSPCESPGLKCFGLQGKDNNWCRSARGVVSSLCCENGWLPFSAGFQACPVPVPEQDPACPPALPNSGAACPTNLFCEYQAPEADEGLSSWCCLGAAWAELGGPERTCPPPP